MSLSSRSLALVWLVIFALFGLTGFGAAAGAPLVWLVAAAFAAPALILRNSREPATTAHDGPWHQLPNAADSMPQPAHAAV
jgi:hypothetical protein